MREGEINPQSPLTRRSAVSGSRLDSPVENQQKTLPRASIPAVKPLVSPKIHTKSRTRDAPLQRQVLTQEYHFSGDFFVGLRTFWPKLWLFAAISRSRSLDAKSEVAWTLSLLLNDPPLIPTNPLSRFNSTNKASFGPKTD
jgi:hypothetical protein